MSDISDPEFAETAQAYIEQYKRVPEANVWVAQAKGLLAKLRELESASPRQRTVNREVTPQVSDSVQASEPKGSDSSLTEVIAEVKSGQDSDGSLEVRRDQTQEPFVQPWIRDWDALGKIRDPGFAETAQAYIARYGKMGEASVWVAKAEGLLAKLRELELASPAEREAGESWVNSSGMEFVWIPAGNFLMGSPEGEEGRSPNERQHEVRISEGFWMKKHEVTQGEWEAVMGTNPSHFSTFGSECPVERVSWDDTQEFIRRLNGWVSGRAYQYRLPTEAEWEYGARAGTPGARYRALDAIAWYRANSRSRPRAVGQKLANAWGLHDMLGNVWEWTGDWYGAYPSGSVTDPKGPESGSSRVYRGGCWFSNAGIVRSAHRYYYAPGDRYNHIGFRLVRTK